MSASPPRPTYGWDTYLSDLVEAHGSLAAVAEALAADRRHREDVATIERALRRVRARPSGDGGTWGARLVRRFGLPRPVERRLAWMGTYHSRFTDLPVDICAELCATWDRAPTALDGSARSWLALARFNLALRHTDRDGALALLATVDPLVAPEVAVERALGEAWIASRVDPSEVDGHLLRVEQKLPEVADPDERACFFARMIDHRGYALHQPPQPDYPATEALYRTIPEEGPPFARARRANGLAWTLWKQGRVEEAAASARAAARHAGDGGHLRLRAMALAMEARITADPAPAARNRAIVAALDDELLRRRGAGRRR